MTRYTLRALQYVAELAGLIAFLAAVLSPFILLAIASEPAQPVFITYEE